MQKYSERHLLYQVEKYKDDVYVGAVAGMGRHKGTLDSQHKLRSAQRHAAVLRKQNDGFTYKVVKCETSLP